MKSNRNYRIHTNILQDNVLNVPLSQDYDCFEVLSLQINQEDLYRADNSNYGVIVGRVLANDAFGIPNAKVSVFIPITDEDAERSEILNLYNYKDVKTKLNNIRYNVLPDSSDNFCYREVGTFPNKRLVLDNDTVLEIYDTYYKFTTCTNNAGDYMIFGVPTGQTQLHTDIDLSDIGVLSQKPRDMMYKGYDASEFDNANQFKESTNLDNLAQIISQDNNVYVYSFFGDKDSEEVAITRCDVQVNYKFEPTCVFMGSIISDGSSNSINHKCTPGNHIGYNDRLVAGEGTIEMIRKTIDGLTEEFQIQGNRLIDENGVWCYQIPMNLDYVGTDEYGNICATDDPNKGIPTRTRVRFRITMDESSSDGLSRHRAKYLVPNNPQLEMDYNSPQIKNAPIFNKHYNFGSATLDEDYRDLYWNNVYSIKNYIPRLQKNGKPDTQRYTGLRTVNEHGDNNVIPFNKVRFRLVFAYRLLCIVMKMTVNIIETINIYVINTINSIKLPLGIGHVFHLPCIDFSGGITETDDNEILYVPGCDKTGQKNTPCPNGMVNCTKDSEKSHIMTAVEQVLAQEFNIINLDFYNDWLNGSLYMPLWYWKKTRKQTLFFNLFTIHRAKNRFCSCDVSSNKLRVVDSCVIQPKGVSNDKGSSWDKNFSDAQFLKWGVIKNVENKDGLNIYYYSPGIIPLENPNDNELKDLPQNYLRLFSTDIILLGSFNDCDLYGIPQLYKRLPSTTANVPELVTQKVSMDDTVAEEEDTEGEIEQTGMDWETKPTKTNPKYGNGLLLGFGCTALETKPKTCINSNRLSELGVTFDASYQDEFSLDGQIIQTAMTADGVITQIEINDDESRAMFATLNHNGLVKMKRDETTGYYIYDFDYIFPSAFDGRQNNSLLKKYQITSKDYSDDDYKLFRYGYNTEKYYGNNVQQYFPFYNNSFFFYFGLKEGKTALDKFNELYDAQCFKNSKSPFTFEIATEAARWCTSESTIEEKEGGCEEDETKYGVIEVNLPDIKKPYSYKLQNLTNKQIIISENNVLLNNLLFGIAINDDCSYETKNTLSADDKVSDYYFSNNTLMYYKKDGKIHYLTNEDNNCGEVVVIDDKKIYVENQGYILTVTDINGNSQTERISINQIPINPIYGNDNMACKFIPQLSSATEDSYTTVKEIYENATYGQIEISGVSIDGYDYIIQGYDDFSSSTTSSIVTTNLQLYNEKLDETQYVQLEIYTSSVYFPDDIRVKTSDSGEILNNILYFCSDGNNVHIELINNVLTFNVWMPSTYTARFTQYCCGDLGLDDEEGNPNSISVLLTVNNGQQFDIIINNQTPLSMVQATKLEDWFDVDKETVISNNTETKVVYNFPNVLTNSNLWEEYITYTTDDYYIDENGFYHLIEEEGEPLNGEAIVSIADYDTRINALEFKFNSLFNLTNATKFSDNGYNYFNFSYVGGRDNVLQGYYPDYDVMNDTEIVFGSSYQVDVNQSSTNAWNWENSKSVEIVCDDSHPNIINQDYAAYKSFSNDWFSIYFLTQQIPFIPIWNFPNYFDYQRSGSYSLNPLIGYYPTSGSVLINYFAAFTNNAEKPYQALPNASVTPYTNPRDNVSFIDQPFNPSHVKNNWFHPYFIDNRMSYYMVIKHLPNNLCRVYGELKNGNRLAYDENYNIIEELYEGDNPTLEYYYKVKELTAIDVKDIKTYHNDSDNTKFYSAFLSSDTQVEVEGEDDSGNTYTYFTNKTIDINPNWKNITPSGQRFPQEYRLTDSENNYVDFTDVGTKLLVNTVSCDYPQQVEIEQETLENTETVLQHIKGYTTAGESVNMLCGLAKPYKWTCGDVYSCQRNGNYNVICNGTVNGGVMTFKAKALRLSLTLSQDTVAERLTYTTYRPLLVGFKTKKELDDFITDISNYNKYNQLGQYSTRATYAYNYTVPYDLYELVYYKYIIASKYNGNKNTLIGKGNCQFKAYKKPEGVWTKDDTRIDNDGDLFKYRYLWDTDSNLLIHSSNPSIYSSVGLRANQNEENIASLDFWKNQNDDAYDNNKGCEIQHNHQYYCVVCGREYYDIDSKLVRALKVFHFNNILYAHNFTVQVNEFNFTDDGTTVNGKLTITIKGIEIDTAFNWTTNIWNSSTQKCELESTWTNINDVQLPISSTDVNGLTVTLEFRGDSINDEGISNMPNNTCYLQFFISINGFVYGFSAQRNGSSWTPVL